MIIKELSVFIFVFGLIQGQPGNPEITLSTGKVKGQLIRFRGLEVYQFLGIPFAEPPVNQLRFKKPVPVKPWNGVVSSIDWPPHCAQAPFPGLNTGYEFSEDCLNVNVFTPAALERGDKKLRAVMVWIHGGGFAYGSANFDLYNGTILAALEDVVYVSMNYRLGALGFLNLPEHGIIGNLGLWDQQLALQWVKSNIKYFGGDPDQVTIFGESAGAMSVSAHILSPQSRGLFKNAILQSGSIYNIELWNDLEASKMVLEKTNCKSAKNVISCLQSADYNVISSLQGFLFWPVHGDDFLPENPVQLVKSIDSSINVLLGVVGNEGASMLTNLDNIAFNAANPVNMTFDQAKTFVGKLFGDEFIDYIVGKFFDNVDPNDPNEIRLAIGQTLGDITLSCPTFAFGFDAVKYSKTNVYAYHQTQKPSKPVFPDLYPDSNWMPATHGDDVPMMFGIPLNYTDHIKEDVILSIMMVDIWGNFAKTGQTQKLGSEWSKWIINESGDIKPIVKELNSEKMNQFNDEYALNCQANWPFPIKQMNLNISEKSEANTHEEL